MHNCNEANTAIRSRINDSGKDPKRKTSNTSKKKYANSNGPVKMIKIKSDH